MNVTQKEASLLKDLKSQEKLCVQKYNQYASQACDPQLKQLLGQIAQSEQTHVDTITQMESGNVPMMNRHTGGQINNQSNQPQFQPSACDQQQKQKDAFFCEDLLSTEKHVSSLYDVSIFEFKDPSAREVLNHIQKEEQQHGEKLYAYMAANQMYS